MEYREKYDFALRGGGYCARIKRSRQGQGGSKMKRILGVGLALMLWAGLPMQTDVQYLETAQVEAKATLSAADREMKRAKSYKETDMYHRAHKIIYPDGRVPNDQRTKIAVVINGDEQVVVEERVKNRIYSQLRKKFPREEFALMKGTDVKTWLLQKEEDDFFDSRPSASIGTNKQPYRSASGFSIGSVAGTIAGIAGGVAVANRHGYDRGVAAAAGALVGGAIDEALAPGTVQENNTSTAMTAKTDVDHMPVGIQPRGFADMRREDFVNAGRAYGYDYVFVVTMNVGLLKHEEHGYIVFDSTTNKGNVWVRVRLVDVANGNYAYRNDIVTSGKTHGTRLSGGGVNGRLMEKAVNQAMNEAMNDIDISLD